MIPWLASGETSRDLAMQVFCRLCHMLVVHVKKSMTFSSHANLGLVAP